MSGKKRKSYTPEYRRDAAHLVIDTGRPIATVAREIGVGEQLLGRWVAMKNSNVWMTRSGAGRPAGARAIAGCGSRSASCGWTGSS